MPQKDLRLCNRTSPLESRINQEAPAIPEVGDHEDPTLHFKNELGGFVHKGETGGCTEEVEGTSDSTP